MKLKPILFESTRFTAPRWTDELRSHIERYATLNDVDQTFGKNLILWVNNKPHLVKPGHESDVKKLVDSMK